MKVKVLRDFKVYRDYRVFKVYRGYKVFKVCRDYRDLLPYQTWETIGCSLPTELLQE